MICEVFKELSILFAASSYLHLIPGRWRRWVDAQYLSTQTACRRLCNLNCSVYYFGRFIATSSPLASSLCWFDRPEWTARLAIACKNMLDMFLRSLYRNEVLYLCFFVNYVQFRHHGIVPRTCLKHLCVAKTTRYDTAWELVNVALILTSLPSLTVPNKQKKRRENLPRRPVSQKEINWRARMGFEPMASRRLASQSENHTPRPSSRWRPILYTIH